MMFLQNKRGLQTVKDLLFAPFKAIKDKVKSFFSFSTDTVMWSLKLLLKQIETEND